MRLDLDGNAAPPPDSLTSHVIGSPPVLLSVSVLVRVWPAGTMNSSDVGLTAPRGVRSAKSLVTVASSAIDAEAVAVS